MKSEGSYTEKCAVFGFYQDQYKHC